MIRPVIFLGLCVISMICNASPPPCANDAIAQAKKLLAFHLGEDDERIAIDTAVTERPSLRNPANPKQQFNVIEVWGYVYKGRYRMRFIYFPSEDHCTLMGQEILEYASL